MFSLSYSAFSSFGTLNFLFVERVPLKRLWVIIVITENPMYFLLGKMNRLIDNKKKTVNQGELLAQKPIGQRVLSRLFHRLNVATKVFSKFSMCEIFLSLMLPFLMKFR